MSMWYLSLGVQAPADLCNSGFGTCNLGSLRLDDKYTFSVTASNKVDSSLCVAFVYWLLNYRASIEYSFCEALS